MAYELVVIGASWGGSNALRALLGELPADFPLATAIVLHREKKSQEILPAMVQSFSPLPVKEAEDKEPLFPGHVYLAPADYHLLIDAGMVALSTDPPVNHARPSIDVLFESAADAYRERVIGIVLTGATSDGAAGLAAIKRRGGMALVQDPGTAEKAAMPEAAIAAAQVDRVLPLTEIAGLLASMGRPIAR